MCGLNFCCGRVVDPVTLFNEINTNWSFAFGETLYFFWLVFYVWEESKCGWQLNRKRTNDFRILDQLEKYRSGAHFNSSRDGQSSQTHSNSLHCQNFISDGSPLSFFYLNPITFLVRNSTYIQSSFNKPKKWMPKHFNDTWETTHLNVREHESMSKDF